MALLIIVGYALLPKNEALTSVIKPISLNGLKTTLAEATQTTDTLSSVDSIANAVPARPTVDSTSQRILFIGDSMLEGLGRRVADYAAGNGHTIHTVCWYSSSSKIWAETDTLQYFLRQDKPTFIMICLCSNELFVRDLDQRDAYIKTILKKIGDIPYVWISPPNWKPDTGINDVIISNVGRKRYFDSRDLELERGKDHAHPTFEAAAHWMDLIAEWMSNPDSTAHPILMAPTDTVVRIKNMQLLQPLRN